MFRFFSILFAIFVIGISLTYHSTRFTRGETMRKNAEFGLNNCRMILNTDADFEMYYLEDWAKKTGTAADYYKLTKEISDFYTDKNRIYEELCRKRYDNRYMMRGIFARLTKLSPTEIEDLKQLHNEIHSSFSTYANDTILKNKGGSILQDDAQAYETAYQKALRDLNNCNAMQQTLFIETEMLHWQTLKYAYIRAICSAIPNQSIVLDSYAFAVVPKKAYYKTNDNFECDIVFAKYASSTKNFRLSANNTELTLKKGIANFSIPTQKTGKHRFTARAEIKNEVTGQIFYLKTDYEYEVRSRDSR